jgi:hypothetical protein
MGLEVAREMTELLAAKFRRGRKNPN